jgi:hypothetical protein
MDGWNISSLCTLWRVLWVFGSFFAFVFTTLFMLFWHLRRQIELSMQWAKGLFIFSRQQIFSPWHWGHYSTDKIPLFVALSSQTWGKFLFDGHLLHFTLVLGWSRHCESCIKLPHEVDSQECRCEWECAVEKVGNCTSTIFYWCLCVMRLLRWLRSRVSIIILGAILVIVQEV